MKTLDTEDGRAEVLARLHRVRPDSMRHWGRMSPHQMICHLSDAFRVVLGDRHSRSTGSVVHRTVLKWFALYVPAPWPREYRTLPESDQEVGGTRPVEFAQDLRELERLFTRFTTAPREMHGRAHPIFGPMTARQWMRWGYLHMDHHLRQFGV